MEELTKVAIALAELPDRITAFRIQMLVFFSVEMIFLIMIIVSLVWIDRRIKEVKRLLRARPYAVAPSERRESEGHSGPTAPGRTPESE